MLLLGCVHFAQNGMSEALTELSHSSLKKYHGAHTRGIKTITSCHSNCITGLVVSRQLARCLLLKLVANKVEQSWLVAIKLACLLEL